MKIQKIAASTILSAFLLGATASAVAQDHRDDKDHREPHKYVEHKEWHKGAKMRREDWGRGERVDYRAHRLNAPPRGYEWREVDGNYVLGEIATGVIASTIIAAGR